MEWSEIKPCVSFYNVYEIKVQLGLVLENIRRLKFDEVFGKEAFKG